MSIHRVCRRVVWSRSWVWLALLLVALPGGAAEAGKIVLYTEAEVLGGLADNLGSSFEVMPLAAPGAVVHPILVDGYDFESMGGAVTATIKAAYESGAPVVILSPTPEAQAFLDTVTGGAVDLPGGLTSRPAAYGETRLEAIAVRWTSGAAAPDSAEFWATFDADDGTAAEEKAEDDGVVASIADWLREAPAAAPAPAPAPPPAPRANAKKKMALKSTASETRASIDDLTSAVARKVSLQFDKGSMATVVKSWAAYSAAQNEDWYIFELTTTSQPQNFETYSFAGMFSDWEKTDAHCRGIAKTGCKRDRYATEVMVKVAPKTPGLELMYYGPDSDRVQDEYTYSSKFTIGGKVTAGYDDKGVKGGVELSGGAEFSRSTKVTIKDATLVGISNPAIEMAGWRFEMPRMRAVNDLSAHGGPSMSCDNLLQMPYPVQRGGMESRQYAIYRLPANQRGNLQGIDIAVSLALEESSSRLQNWTAHYCNIFNCNCSPDGWVHKRHELSERVISFPLAAHPQ